MPSTRLIAFNTTIKTKPENKKDWTYESSYIPKTPWKEFISPSWTNVIIKKTKSCRINLIIAGIWFKSS